MNQRLNPDGTLAVDVVVNPKAGARKQRESDERAALEAFGVSPWTREDLQAQLDKVNAGEVLTVFDGKPVQDKLDLSGDDLSGLNLSGMDLSGVNLHGAKLVGTVLMGTNLEGANLHSADLSAAVMTAAKLDGANLCEACLCAADVTSASLRRTNLSDACVEDCIGLGMNQKITASKDGSAVALVREKDDSLEGANITGLTTSHVEFEAAAGLENPGTLGK